MQKVMNRIELGLEKEKRYVVACSFGPDSMALLASAIENGLSIVVAHVNYRKRDAAVFEQSELEKYCKERNIKIYVLDLLGEKHKGNFQDWARQKRYEFFKEVAYKEDASAVLVAHQQDDVIETYLMQKKRGNIVKNLGISVENDIFGVKVIRPLLSYSKQQLKDFDEINHIPYSIDESNLTDHYSRNKIRHEIVEKLSQEERNAVLEEIANSKKVEVEFKTIWQKKEFETLSYEQVVSLLGHYMELTFDHVNLSKGFVDEIKKALSSSTNCIFELTNALRLEIDYGILYLVNKKRLQPYEIEFNKKAKNEFLDIDFSSGAEDRNIPANNLNLVVKNLDKNSKTIIKNYSVKIKRLFIDWKMPHFLRIIWPGIFDEKGNLLYIPRYRRNFEDKHKSKFVIATAYFTKF